MSEKEIEAENNLHLQKYHNYWNKSTSPPEEQKATDDAYRQAFERFPEIYHSIGWSDNEDIVFNAENLAAHRELLIEAIFTMEVQRMDFLDSDGGREKSRALFEYSRLPRLLTILTRLENRRYDCVECRDGQCVDWRVYNADTILKVLIQAGRASQKAKLTDGLNNTSLEDLLKQCYARRILSQDELKSPVHLLYQFHLIYDCLAALVLTTRYMELRDPLTYTFYLRYKSLPIHQIFQMVQSHYKLTDGQDDFPPFPLEESPAPSFSPAQFNLSYLQDFGDLAIEWTDSLSEHLTIFTGPHRNALRVFAHPTYLYNGHDLLHSEHDYFQPTFIDLPQAPIPSPKPNPKPNPHRTPFNQILSSPFLTRLSLPPTLQTTFNLSHPSTTIKPLGPCHQTKITSAPMRDILSLHPYYPEDIRFMMRAVFEHDLSMQDQPFIRFAYFGPRLRMIKTFLDSKRPSTLRQVWVDRRDAREWWRFWGSVLFMLMVGMGVWGVVVAVAVAVAVYRI
ncbi:hypothetical protein BO70DRAFT_372023 [Aspergillus heteromorphus CBS 117.55]|uniref:Uncharacterized protein n=1 Tax=Aspergillus heteromorphus CBS 117.55 TaxID=1448321 RepID=A0A317VZA6_9EURO|nr:uncharacterized protein BO70DRAFT_372023 [Aspergillus heteromorphus CBS 117.55]PWY78268.1 hypothetical protein BO70DRAFT_372023 [Aspergillus heteromorphus CBS 117.55]